MKKHLQVRKVTSVAPQTGGQQWQDGFGIGIAVTVVGLVVIGSLIAFGAMIQGAN